MRRHLVALTPIRGAHWSGVRGVTVSRFFTNSYPMTSVCVRVVARLDEGSWLPGEPVEAMPGLFVDTLPRRDDAMPIKGSADVTAAYEGAEILRERRVEVTSAGARIALDPRAERLEPAPFQDGTIVFLESDLPRFHRVREEQRLQDVGPDIAWHIDGETAASGVLGFTIGVRADFTDGERLLVPMSIDGVEVRLLDRSVELVYRGLFVEGSGRLVDRLVIGVLPGSERESEDVSRELDGALSAAWFGLAASADDAASGRRPPELDDDRRAAARLSAWSDGPGEPSLTPEEYRSVQSELQRRPRAEALAAHGFDEISWTREEWAVGEILARGGQAASDVDADDDAALRSASLDPALEAWLAALTPARATEGAPPLLDLDAFAKLSAHVSVRDPARVLGEAKMTVSEYVAREADVLAALDEDPAAADAFAASVARYTLEAEELAERERASLMEDP
ncbi:MAG: hypothetical protein U0414_33620 [Polyangiaceae bacterium]